MRIGIYLGTDDDPTDNVVVPLVEIGRCLSSHDLEAFGSASLPSSAQKFYTKISTTPRSPQTPYTKIIGAYRDCSEYVSWRSPDIIFQMWKFQTHGTGLSLAGRRTNTPVLTRFVGDIFEEYRGYSGLKRIGVFVLNNILARIPMKTSNAMIVLGPSGATQAISYGMTQDNILLIPPPGELDDRFSPSNDKNADRKKLNLPVDRDIALFVGRLSRQKGMKFLTHVIDRVTSEQEMLFVLVGEGSYHDYLAAKFSEEVVQLPGYVSHEEIHRFYKAADVYVHPSPYEGIPLVLLEAMNCGLPVVSRPAGDIEFLTPNIARTPADMADMIISQNWSHEWLNKKYFTNKYHDKRLNEAVSLLRNSKTH